MFDEDCCNIRRQHPYVKSLKERFQHNREITEQSYTIKRIFEKSLKKIRQIVRTENIFQKVLCLMRNVLILDVNIIMLKVFRDVFYIIMKSKNILCYKKNI